MLLRSLTKHVKDQNWFAVFLDFFIVVAGILIAFQITNWNETRAERALESEYTERLHKEVIDLEAVRRNMIVERRRALAELSSATQKLMNSDGGKLNSVECYWLVNNPATSNPTDDLPLIIELLSSGRFSIFSNRDLEKALGDYLITRTRARDSRLGIIGDKPRPDINYPQFHQIQSSLLSATAPDFLTEEDFDTLSITCDEDGMRSNQAFLNDLARLEELYHYHIRDNNNVSTALAKLHAVLDQILAVDHMETE